MSVFLVVCVCTCTDKGISPAVSVCASVSLHTSIQQNVVCDGLQIPDTLISPPFVFAHEAERKMKEEKKTFECLEMSVREHSFLGIIAFKY